MGKLTASPEAGKVHAPNVIGGAASLVRAGHVGWADSGDVHAIYAVELLGLELIEALVHGVLARAVHRVVLVDQPVAEGALLPADGHRAGVDHPVDAAYPGRLEAVVHAQHVQLHREVGRVVAAAQQVGQVHDPVGLGGQHRLHHVLELGDVAVHHAYQVPELLVRHRPRVDVHYSDPLASFGQPAYGPSPDEPGAAQYQRRHTAS